MSSVALPYTRPPEIAMQRQDNPLPEGSSSAVTPSTASPSVARDADKLVLSAWVSSLLSTDSQRTQDRSPATHQTTSMASLAEQGRVGAASGSTPPAAAAATNQGNWHRVSDGLSHAARLMAQHVNAAVGAVRGGVSRLRAANRAGADVVVQPSRTPASLNTSTMFVQAQRRGGQRDIDNEACEKFFKRLGKLSFYTAIALLSVASVVLPPVFLYLGVHYRSKYKKEGQELLDLIHCNPDSGPLGNELGVQGCVDVEVQRFETLLRNIAGSTISRLNISETALGACFRTGGSLQQALPPCSETEYPSTSAFINFDYTTLVNLITTIYEKLISHGKNILPQNYENIENGSYDLLAYHAAIKRMYELKDAGTKYNSSLGFIIWGSILMTSPAILFLAGLGYMLQKCCPGEC